MSLVRKCDRCGAYYDVENNTHSEYFQMRVLGVELVGRSIPSEGVFNSYDLCDMCVNDLKDFLNYTPNRSETE